MAGTYDNNENRPTVTVYTPINFSNPESKLEQSRLSITYFNRMMTVTISPRFKGNVNELYPTYSKEGSIQAFITATQAKLLHDAFMDLISGKNGKHNICISTKDKLLMLNDGVDKGIGPYAAIFFVDPTTKEERAMYYEFKRNYTVPCDYNNGQYDSIKFPDYEINTLLMTLQSYYEASSYAIAATVAESSMYRNANLRDLVRAIANKVGVPPDRRNNDGQNYLSRAQAASATENNYGARSGSNDGFDPITAIDSGGSAPSFSDLINSSLS